MHSRRGLQSVHRGKFYKFDFASQRTSVVTGVETFFMILLPLLGLLIDEIMEWQLGGNSGLRTPATKKSPFNQSSLYA
jgi:hypothetical protein